MTRSRKGDPIHGWLILDKPQGLTSTQALGKARRLLGAGKAGHGGTLDPLATGILPLAFGEATKLIPQVMDGIKQYQFTLRWGEARSTEDSEGEITAVNTHRPARDAIIAALPGFTGIITQTPPVYSAIKIGGKRAYDLARAGNPVEPAARQVQIIDLQLISIDDADHAVFQMTCGKGTYVRSLARDLALSLGTVGHVSSLRRTKSGVFTLSHAISLEKLAELAHKGAALTALHPIASALDDIPAHAIDAQEAQRLRRGQPIILARAEDGTQTQAMFATLLATHDGMPVALIALKEGMWRVVRGFNL